MASQLRFCGDDPGLLTHRNTWKHGGDFSWLVNALHARETIVRVHAYLIVSELVLVTEWGYSMLFEQGSLTASHCGQRATKMEQKEEEGSSSRGGAHFPVAAAVERALTDEMEPVFVQCAALRVYVSIGSLLLGTTRSGIQCGDAVLELCRAYGRKAVSSCIQGLHRCHRELKDCDLSTKAATPLLRCASTTLETATTLMNALLSPEEVRELLFATPSTLTAVRELFSLFSSQVPNAGAESWLTLQFEHSLYQLQHFADIQSRPGQPSLASEFAAEPSAVLNAFMRRLKDSPSVLAAHDALAWGSVTLVQVAEASPTAASAVRSQAPSLLSSLKAFVECLHEWKGHAVLATTYAYFRLLPLAWPGGDPEAEGLIWHCYEVGLTSIARNDECFDSQPMFDRDWALCTAEDIARCAVINLNRLSPEASGAGLANIIQLLQHKFSSVSTDFHETARTAPSHPPSQQRKPAGLSDSVLSPPKPYHRDDKCPSPSKLPRRRLYTATKSDAPPPEQQRCAQLVEDLIAWGRLVALCCGLFHRQLPCPEAKRGAVLQSLVDAATGSMMIARLFMSSSTAQCTDRPLELVAVLATLAVGALQLVKAWSGSELLLQGLLEPAAGSKTSIVHALTGFSSHCVNRLSSCSLKELDTVFDASLPWAQYSSRARALLIYSMLTPLRQILVEFDSVRQALVEVRPSLLFATSLGY